MRRIVVIGTTGSGKSTLAERAAVLLHCPFIELDALFWTAGWQKAPKDEFRQRVAAALAGEQWVVGGNYSVARDLIWSRADTLVWLDYPLPLVLWRLGRRTIRRIVTREPLWGGNVETWRGQFASRDSLFVWAFKTHARRRREMPVLLAQPENTHLKLLHFRKPSAAVAWLHELRVEASGSVCST